MLKMGQFRQRVCRLYSSFNSSEDLNKTKQKVGEARHGGIYCNLALRRARQKD